MNRLADALFDRTLQGILGLTYAQPERTFSEAEIVARVARGSDDVRARLEALASGGHLLTRRIGPLVRYRANAASPIFPELHGIAVKTFGIVEPIREALTPLRDFIVAAWVADPLATGEARATSYVRVVSVVRKIGRGEVEALLTPLDLGRPLHAEVHTEGEWRAMSAMAKGGHGREAKLFVMGDAKRVF